MFPLYLSLPSLQMLCLVRSHKEIIYSCPPVLVCISMPAEHVNLSLGYRRWVVKLSSDSLQQDDHRMPVARRIRAVVMISNGGPNVLLHCNSLNCTNCMTQWYAKKGLSAQNRLVEKMKRLLTAAVFENLPISTNSVLLLRRAEHNTYKICLSGCCALKVQLKICLAICQR